MNEFLTTGQMASAANVRLSTLKLWMDRYPDEFVAALYGPEGTAPDPAPARAGRVRGRAWRRFRRREALLLNVIGVVVGFGSNPESALRICENLSHVVSESGVWPLPGEAPNLSERSFLVITQEMHWQADPDDIARGVLTSRARRRQYEVPGQPYTPMKVCTAKELVAHLVEEDSYPTMAVDLAREWKQVQARLATFVERV